MTLKSELKRELKSRGLSLSDLRKKTNKTHKSEILAVLTRRGIADGLSKEKLAKEIRKIKIDGVGFSFANDTYRDIYDYSTTNPKKIKPSQLRKGAKPNPKKLINLNRNRPTQSYLYVFKVYLYPNDTSKYRSKQFKKIPKRKNIILISNKNTYIKTQEIGGYNENLLTRNEVMRTFLASFIGNDETDPEILSEIALIGSDKMSLESGFYPVAYEYVKVLKDF